MKKLLSLVLLLLGAASYGGSVYIEKEVLHGQSQIDDAKKKIKKADSLFSISPYTEPFGDALTGGAKGKIKEGEAQIEYYTDLAAKLKTGGIALMILGAITLPFTFRKKVNKR